MPWHGPSPVMNGTPSPAGGSHRTAAAPHNPRALQWVCLGFQQQEGCSVLHWPSRENTGGRTPVAFTRALGVMIKPMGKRNLTEERIELIQKANDGSVAVQENPPAAQMLKADARAPPPRSTAAIGTQLALGSLPSSGLSSS